LFIFCFIFLMEFLNFLNYISSFLLVYKCWGFFFFFIVTFHFFVNHSQFVIHFNFLSFFLNVFSVFLVALFFLCNAFL
jgi:hypothetical protein